MGYGIVLSVYLRHVCKKEASQRYPSAPTLYVDRERNDLRAAAHAQEAEQELLLRELASTEHRLRSLQARDVTVMPAPRAESLTP